MTTEPTSTTPTERSVLFLNAGDEPRILYTEPLQLLSETRFNSVANSNVNIKEPSSPYSRKASRRRNSISPEALRRGSRASRRPSLSISQGVGDERLWYDQFTSTDWVHDAIADGYRALQLKSRRDTYGRLRFIFDSAQGWILVALISCLTAITAYTIDVAESVLFDLKRGYCAKRWYLSQLNCCKGEESCKSWYTWSRVFGLRLADSTLFNYLAFILGCTIFASVSAFLTSLSKTTIPSHIATTFGETLENDKQTENLTTNPSSFRPTKTHYSAAGSGVAEVKVILSGFIMHGYLGLKTFLLKSSALVFAVASGMSLGKEGPYVHLATCIGNIACRIFDKYNFNDGKRREILSAAAASGVAVAFGSPLGGILFSLEEVSYYFPPKTLFRTFFACIVAALTLKFLNPYGTNRIVLFEVRYITDWNFFELVNFVVLGIAGGLAGAGFIKMLRIWATTFRQWELIKSNPIFEVLLVALVTGFISFWNRYANLSVVELLSELASPCVRGNKTGLCPSTRDDIPGIIGYLLIALAIKAFLTTITFGIKVPAGIYVPSMVCGGLIGRILGHAVQYAILSVPESQFFGHCAASDDMEHCVTPGVYALVAAGATMCGVTRLSVTLAVILFELTGSLDHVLPFALGVLVAKWTADLVEPCSIYDLLIEMNSYPYIDNHHIPLFDIHAELSDITPRPNSQSLIDVSSSPYVSAFDLRTKLKTLRSRGELDGGLPVIRQMALVGFISALDLEFALDHLVAFDNDTLCLIWQTHPPGNNSSRNRWFAGLGFSTDDGEFEEDTTHLLGARSDTIASQHQTQHVSEVDLVPFVDPAPISLELHSPMNLVYQCFFKLGLRYVCVVEGGEYRGMVHKKQFIRYIKTVESKHG